MADTVPVCDAAVGAVAPPGGETLISARHVNKTFGEMVALDDVSLDVGRGDFIALLGPSGCGKSTLLNMIAGLIPPSSGEISIAGEPVRYGVANPKVGYVFQRDTLFPWRTVRQNIAYGLQLRHIGRQQQQEMIAQAIAMVDLQGFEDKYPISLSGGMRQRVSLMRTLVLKPEVLLMDEPFGALDAHTKLDMHRILLDLWEMTRPTVVFVTHDLTEALTLADRIVLMSARPGRIKTVYEIDFPRPRDAVALRETAEYAALFQRVWHSLGEEFRRHGAD